MHVGASVKIRCPHCYMVRRKKNGKKVLYVYCKKSPSHKQRQG